TARSDIRVGLRTSWSAGSRCAPSDLDWRICAITAVTTSRPVRTHVAGAHHHALISMVLVARLPTSPIPIGTDATATGETVHRPLPALLTLYSITTDSHRMSTSAGKKSARPAKTAITVDPDSNGLTSTARDQP